MKSFILPAGSKFGKLTTEEAVAGLHTLVKCKCDCGRFSYPVANNIVRGLTTSCGCNKTFYNGGSSLDIPFGFKTKWTANKAQAKIRGLSWEITPQQYMKLIVAPCTYCGKDTGQGIDRIDSNRGYTDDNVCACCKTCNYMKRDLSLEDFKNHIALVYRYYVR